ncbi:TPA: epoxyqueuosine reductase [Thermoplasmata archaeon]|nr:epoxyqueuosine reductase [Thermoplasmata archaeon]
MVVFGVLSRDDTHELAVRIRGEEYEYPGYVPLSHVRRRVGSVLKDRGFDHKLPRELNSFISFKRIAPLAGIGAFGKNSLIINPEHGPWLRFALVLTDAPLKPNRPFTRDLCGDCVKCIRACPVDALRPYVVDDRRCLVGVDPWKSSNPETASIMRQYQPKVTKRSYVMCTACQMACPFTSAERREDSHIVPDIEDE